MALTDKRDGLKRQGKLYKTIKATSLPEEKDLMATHTRAI